MSRYVSYVSHQVLDDLFNYPRFIQQLFQDKLDSLEKEPFKGSTLLPSDRSNDPGWVSRVAGIRTVVLLEGTKYRALVYFKVGPTQLKVHGFTLRPVETEDAAGS